MVFLRLQQNYIRAPGKIKVPGRPREDRPAWRVVSIVAACGLLGACAAGPRLEPMAAPSEPSVTVADAGIQLTIFPNTWSSYPADLPRYYTPVEVRIANTRGEELQVRYEDFVALDDGNNQYRAVPPAEVTQALFGALDVYAPWYPYWPRPWGWRGSRGYWDPYDYGYGWPRAAAQDVLLLGLRSGPLLPGASVQGFLYFQQATVRGASLAVSWIPRLAGNAPLATLSTQFRIIRR